MALNIFIKSTPTSSMVLKTFPMVLFFRKRFSLGNIINHKLDLKDSVCCLLSKMDQEKSTLTWHTYSDHLRNILKEISSDDSFADVTLVTDDKKQIKAHRNILSACSPVFKNILQLDSNNTNSVIYLRGIHHSEVESIMQFIYLGEARFYEERISEFLMVSKDLEIKDLSSTGIRTNYQPDSNKDSDFSENNDTDEDVGDNPAQTFKEDEVYVENEIQTTNRPTIRKSAAIKRVSRTDDGKYACNQCDYLAGHKSHLTKHIESIHEGIKHACNQCEYQTGYKSDLKKHHKSIHEGVRYACNQCDYQSSSQGNLTAHKKRNICNKDSYEIYLVVRYIDS